VINQASRDHLSKNYNLEERTALLAEHIIDEVKSISINSINKRIIEQLIGSSGSIGANYCEAVESESKKDFVHKISIAKKEIILIKHLEYIPTYFVYTYNMIIDHRSFGLTNKVYSNYYISSISPPISYGILPFYHSHEISA